MTTKLKDNVIFRIQNKSNPSWPFVDPSVRYSRQSKIGKFWFGAGPLLQHINLNLKTYTSKNFVVLAYDAQTLQSKFDHPYNAQYAETIPGIRDRLKNRKPDRQVLFAIRHEKVAGRDHIQYNKAKGAYAWKRLSDQMHLFDFTQLSRFLRNRTRYNHTNNSLDHTKIIVFTVVSELSFIHKMFEFKLNDSSKFDREHANTVIETAKNLQKLYSFSENFQAPINIPSIWSPDAVKRAQEITYSLTTTQQSAPGAIGHVPVFPSAVGANGPSDPNANVSRCF